MNICPVCRNVNEPDVTVCRYCRTALTPPGPVDVDTTGQGRRVWPWLAGAATLLLVLAGAGLTVLGGGGAAASTTEVTTLVVGTGEGASLEFEPPTISAAPNTPIAITFNNQSTLPHNLTFQEPISSGTSPNLEGGQSETITLTTPGPGSYTFVCTIHPGMQGELIIQ